MIRIAGQYEEFYVLLDELCDGTLSEDGAKRLDERLRNDPEARWEYLAYLEVHAGLVLTAGNVPAQGTPVVSDGLPTRLQEEENENEPLPTLPVILTTTETSAKHIHPFAPGGIFFSYGVAAAVVGIALLIGWGRQISNLQDFQDRDETQFSSLPMAVEPEPEMEFIGRITGMIDCRWTHPESETTEGGYVALGRHFSLVAGLLEITYENGAKVVLQGPCRFHANSHDGGYLEIGKLTANVEKRAESGRGPKAARFHSSPTSRGGWFAIRTPTAIISDLGTEFGVTVEESGASQADVFRGKIQVRLVAHEEEHERTVVVEENQSARIAPGTSRRINVIRGSSSQHVYVRQMPKPVRIALFNTGVGLNEGEKDPHWQLVARSDDPNFRPCPAVATRAEVIHALLPNNPKISQWVSAVGDGSPLPENVTYTFRTTFDLKGLSPKSARLRGRFLADDHVTALRLNGRHIRVPEHRWGQPFIHWCEFKIAEGFLDGSNVLDVDVLNSDPVSHGRPSSPMLFRMEIEGIAYPHSGVSAEPPAAVPTTNRITPVPSR